MPAGMVSRAEHCPNASSACQAAREQRLGSHCGLSVTLSSDSSSSLAMAAPPAAACTGWLKSRGIIILSADALPAQTPFWALQVEMGGTPRRSVARALLYVLAEHCSGHFQSHFQGHVTCLTLYLSLCTALILSIGRAYDSG